MCIEKKKGKKPTKNKDEGKQSCEEQYTVKFLLREVLIVILKGPKSFLAGTQRLTEGLGGHVCDANSAN